MPRVVEHDPETARRLDLAIKAIAGGTPTNPTLVAKANRGTLRLNFATVQVEADVKRHLFDKAESLYSAQFETIRGLMTARGKTDPLAVQLAECRLKLERANRQLGRAQDYNAHLLTLAHQLELEAASLREEVATLLGDGTDGDLVGSGRLIGLPATPKRRIGPGQGRRAR